MKKQKVGIGMKIKTHQKEAELTWSDDGILEEIEEEDSDGENSDGETEQPAAEEEEEQTDQNVGAREGRTRRLP